MEGGQMTAAAAETAAGNKSDTPPPEVAPEVAQTAPEEAGGKRNEENLDDNKHDGQTATGPRDLLEKELKALQKKNEELTNDNAKLSSAKEGLENEVDKLSNDSALAELISKNHELIEENKALKRTASSNERKRKLEETTKEEEEEEDSSSPNNKKSKTSSATSSNNKNSNNKVVDEKDVKITMQVAHRKDVPKDVLALVKLLRNEIKTVKRTSNRRIKALEKQVEDANEKLEIATLPPDEQAKKRKAKAAKPPPASGGLSYEEKLKSDRAKAAKEAAAAGTALQHIVSFEDRIKELELFIKGNGHAKVPIDAGDLGRWVMNIRKNYRIRTTLSEEELKNRVCYSAADLNADRITKLESMGFIWRAGPKLIPWEERIRQLEVYKAEHGTLETIQRNHPTLGEFVHTIRRNFREKKLPDDRMKQLTELGFIFDTGQKKITFEERLDECREFRIKHGHLLIPFPPRGKQAKLKEHGKSPKEVSFCRWAVMMRDEWKRYQQGLKCRIDKKRITTLTGLGFVWDPLAPPPAPNRPPKDTPKPRELDIDMKRSMPEEDKWDFNMAMLRYVCAQHGTIADYKFIQKEFPNCHQEIRNWLMVQRKKYRSNAVGDTTSLTVERQKQLEDLGFDFDPNGRYRNSINNNSATVNNNNYAAPKVDGDSTESEAEKGSNFDAMEEGVDI